MKYLTIRSPRFFQYCFRLFFENLAQPRRGKQNRVQLETLYSMAISKLFLANSIFFQEVTVQLGHVSLQSDAQSNQGESPESLKDLPCVIVHIEYRRQIINVSTGTFTGFCKITKKIILTSYFHTY